MSKRTKKTQGSKAEKIETNVKLKISNLIDRRPFVGLFAADAEIAKGSVICYGCRHAETYESSDEAADASKGVDPYHMFIAGVNDGNGIRFVSLVPHFDVILGETYTTSKPSRLLAGFCNSAKSSKGANAVLESEVHAGDTATVTLKATKKINAGDEILVYYGSNYYGANTAKVEPPWEECTFSLLKLAEHALARSVSKTQTRLIETAVKGVNGLLELEKTSAVTDSAFENEVGKLIGALRQVGAR